VAGQANGAIRQKRKHCGVWDSAYDRKHGFLFCVDAHCDRKRFIPKADDLLTAFLSIAGRLNAIVRSEEHKKLAYAEKRATNG
jgi:hypothetical protein